DPEALSRARQGARGAHSEAHLSYHRRGRRQAGQGGWRQVMGQKVNPIGLRLGIIRDWSARWYANSSGYTENLIADLKIRRFLKEKLAHAAVSQIVIERPAQ